MGKIGVFASTTSADREKKRKHAKVEVVDRGYTRR